MGLLNFFSKKKTPLKKFDEIKASVQSHTKFLMDDNYEGLDSKTAASKALFRIIDKEQRKKLGMNKKNKLDKLDEIKHVLEILKDEVKNGDLSAGELQEILNSKEFKDYSEIK